MNSLPRSFLLLLDSLGGLRVLSRLTSLGLEIKLAFLAPLLKPFSLLSRGNQTHSERGKVNSYYTLVGATVEQRMPHYLVPSYEVVYVLWPPLIYSGTFLVREKCKRAVYPPQEMSTIIIIFINVTERFCKK